MVVEVLWRYQLTGSGKECAQKHPAGDPGLLPAAVLRPDLSLFQPGLVQYSRACWPVGVADSAAAPGTRLTVDSYTQRLLKNVKCNPLLFDSLNN